MGDSRRFHLFAQCIKSNFPNASSIADVAGGKGYLNLALKNLGYKRVVTFDTRGKFRVNGIEYHTKLFDSTVPNEYDLLVGMHPDEATDHIIVEAGKRRIPFLIVPCCVKPSAITFWGNHVRRHWFAHLVKLAESFNMQVNKTTLRMNGRNEVFIGIPT